MSKTAIFTIASKNYIAYARTLLQSVSVQHPEADRYLLLVDEPTALLDLSLEDYSVVLVKDIGIQSFDEMAFQYDILEFNTAVKPFFMKWLLEKGYNKVVYFDPDIMLFNKIDMILDILNSYSIVLTPHITRPVANDDKCLPGERAYLVAGTYNLGFIAVSKTAETVDFLEWWSERCSYECFSEVENGFFVDQKWINLVPGLYGSVKIVRDIGCNMAYWNLHERYLNVMSVNGESPLVFYHFSGIDPLDNEQLSKYQDRYTLAARPDLKELFKLYRKELIKNGYMQTKDLSYTYACYDNGEKIGPLARRLYAVAPETKGSPFKTGNNTYYELLIKKNLLEKVSSKKYTKENTTSIKSKLDFMLFILLKIVGPSKYNLLMHYLRHISVLRKQTFIFRINK